MENNQITAVNQNGELKKTDLFLPVDFDWNTLDSAEKATNIAPKYIEFEEKGHKIRCQFLGIAEIDAKDKATGDLKKFKTAFFLSKDGHLMNSGTALVTDLERFCEPKSFIEIEYLGEKKTSNGNKMKEFAIYPLSLTK